MTVVITLSSLAYDEIKQKMEQAGCQLDNDDAINMHGITVNKNEALEISQALCAKDE